MSMGHLASAIGLALLVGCAGSPHHQRVAQAGGVPAPAGTEQPWAAPPIERAVTVFDGRTGAVLTFGEMVDALAGADAVFLGETHIDETTHRVELAVYERLLARREGAVVLAMEMFDRDVQPVLDAYLAGELGEGDFLVRSRAWGQYRSAYRPLIERARAGGHPVVASNFPRPLLRRVGMEGLAVLDTLDGEARAQAPAEIYPNPPEYWRRVDNAVRGHLAMMRQATEGDDQRLSSTQTLWDNAMGESCALALDAHPGAMVLHVNGGFHSMYWSGTVGQFARRRPGARVLTVDIRSARNPSVVRVDAVPTADFVVMAETRAMDENEGTWSVALDRELEYQFHLPEGATDAHPVPLLLWLGDDGLSSADGLDLWRDRLGDDAAIAVLEPPYHAQLDDLSEGGRWFWPGSFAEDTGSVVASTERVWEYLLRHYPIDPARVCIAGEGTGATVAAAVALLGDRMEHKTAAFEPRHYAKLKDFPLPLPEYGGGTDRAVSLTVFGGAEDESWWGEELAAYRGVGLAASFAGREHPAAGRDGDQAAALREALGLPALETAAAAESVFMTVPTDSPRARHWARLYALRSAAATGRPVTLVEAGEAPTEGGPTIMLTDVIDPATIGDALPRCPGPFGGTTVLVLPAGQTPAGVQAWTALEAHDPLTVASRFHRLRIAVLDASPPDRALPNMLAALESEGRKNVLIVPAVFCADPETMRALERQARPFANRMTIQWLPGLGGGELPLADAGSSAGIDTVGRGPLAELPPAPPQSVGRGRVE